MTEPTEDQLATDKLIPCVTGTSNIKFSCTAAEESIESKNEKATAVISCVCVCMHTCVHLCVHLHVHVPWSSNPFIIYQNKGSFCLWLLTLLTKNTSCNLLKIRCWLTLLNHLAPHLMFFSQHPWTPFCLILVFSLSSTPSSAHCLSLVYYWVILFLSLSLEGSCTLIILFFDHLVLLKINNNCIQLMCFFALGTLVFQSSLQMLELEI